MSGHSRSLTVQFFKANVCTQEPWENARTVREAALKETKKSLDSASSRWTRLKRSRARERYFIKRENVNCTSKSWYLLSKAYFILARIVGRSFDGTPTQKVGTISGTNRLYIVINVCTDPDPPGTTARGEAHKFNKIHRFSLSFFFFYYIVESWNVNNPGHNSRNAVKPLYQLPKQTADEG